MKQVAAILALLFASVASFGAIPAPLDEAIRKWVADEDHWAYTQRSSIRIGLTGTKINRVERFDPSQPDERQWSLLLWNGKTPTEAEIRDWKRQKAREVRNRQRPLGDFFDLTKATIAEETATTIRYEVPFVKATYKNFPLNKISSTIVVDKQRRTLVGLDLGLDKPFRVGMGLASVTDAALSIRFRTIDEKYASQPESIHANGSAKVAFLFKTGGSADVTWSDFQRVIPYKTRFEVKIGELRALGF